MKRKHTRWSTREQVKFLKQLSVLLERGYPLLEAISFLLLHMPKEKQFQLKERIKEMREGSTFYSSLSMLSFNKEVLGYLYFAEKHGDLSFALKESSNLLEIKLNYRNRLYKVIQYPLFLIVITIGLMIMINLFLLPEFSTIFESMTVGNSSILLSFMTFTAKWIPRFTLILLLLIIVCSVFCFFNLKKIPLTTKMEWVSKLPIYGFIIVKFYSQYFAMQLSQLLKGGLSVFESLTIFERQDHFPLLKLEAIRIKQELRGGETLASIIYTRPYFEEELAKTIAFGSANGDLSRELYFYSKLSSEALEEHLNQRLAVIQPTVFLAIGLFIMGIYLAIMQPMLDMINGL